MFIDGVEFRGVDVGRVPHLLATLSAEQQTQLARRGVEGMRVNGDQVIIPHSMSNRGLLGRLGGQLPPADAGYTYAGKLSVWGHQKTMALAQMNNRRLWVLSEPRTGKTLATIHAIMRLRATKDIDRVLILAPRAIIESSWYQEICWVDITASKYVYVGTKGSAALAKAMKNPAIKIVIATVDILRTSHAIAQAEWDLVVADEATRFKNPQAERAKIFAHIIKSNNCGLWALTGTPCTTSPMDVWNVGRFINKDKVPPSYTAWRNRVMFQVNHFWVPKPHIENQLADALQPSVRIQRDDVFDIPPLLFTSLPQDMTKEQKRVIAQLDKSNRSQLKGGELITAPQRAAAMMKIFQVAAGVVYQDDGTAVVLDDVVGERCKEIVRILEESQAKVIVLCPFRSMHDAYRSELEKQSGTTVLSMQGGAAGTQGRRIQDSFRTDDSIKILLAHPQVIQFGVNASRANSTVWLSPVVGPEAFVQANDRMFSEVSASKKRLDVYMLSCCDIERARYSALRDKVSREGGVLSMARQFETYYGG